MTEALTQIENMVWTHLIDAQAHTPESIREMIAGVRELSFIGDITDDEAERLARQFEERVNVTQNIGSRLIDRGHQPWLDAAKENIDPYYWSRYRRHLVREGFPPASVTSLDEVTDRVLGMMQNPATAGAWDRRGLVVGHVQSGKTANYTGLICKAADAGYRVIIIIAGIHNNLRSQTQQRIDEGFIGRDSARLLSRQADMFVGVGEFNRTRLPSTLTNTVRDFNKNTATSAGIPIQNLNEPAVFVIKKNSSTLRNLTEWLREYGALGSDRRIGEPMLIIDDEADNASINIRRGAGEVSTINRQLRQLLELFDKSCYIGYTATPFANIFIDPDTDDEMLREDLFPRSFIVSLDPPSNYFGPTEVFIDDSEAYIRYIDDNEDHIPIIHRNDFFVESLPDSLLDAIRTFILGRAIRLARHQERQHNSMLVNASRFVAVQFQLRNAIHSALDDIKNSIRIYGALPPEDALQDTEISALRCVWDREFPNTEFSWSRIQELLHTAASPIRVVEVNSRSAGTLDYGGNSQDGLNVIAVGGYSLSRGLTLEGLMVSYFLRNSKMYDTLMQMGRWFGYRPDYQDLCRIWMPEDAEGWYEHIADSIEELRDELRFMEASNATPEEFGLKVRSHPDNLIVTARNKMGTGQPVKMNISLSSRLIETHTLRRDRENLQRNHESSQKLAGSLGEAGYPIESAENSEFGWLLRCVPVGPILDFLIEFRNHDDSLQTSGEPVRRYIRERMNGELAKWDVLFASLNRGATAEKDRSLGRTILRQRRTEGNRSDSRTLYVGNRQRVSTRGIERTGLSDKQRKVAERDYEDFLKRDGRLAEGKRPNYPDRVYRNRRVRPLLMIHLMDIDPRPESNTESQTVVAWGISFPPTRTEEKPVEYVVNTTWIRENYGDDVDEDEMYGEDD